MKLRIQDHLLVSFADLFFLCRFLKLIGDLYLSDSVMKKTFPPNELNYDITLTSLINISGFHKYFL